jgi:hypothetical protein
MRYKVIYSASPSLPPIMQLFDMHLFPYLSSTTKRSGRKVRRILAVTVSEAKLYKYRNVTRQDISIQRGFMLAVYDINLLRFMVSFIVKNMPALFFI